MRTDTSLIIMLLVLLVAIMLVTFTSPLLIDIYGQTATTTEKVTEVQEQLQGANQQLDTTSVATAAGIGVGGIALAREYLNSKKLKESDKRTDRDTGRSFLYLYRLIQTMDAMIPEIGKCLDQPFNADPMQKHITIRMKLAEDANSTAEYLMTQLNTVVPSMTPAAAVIVADATNQIVASKAVAETQAAASNTATPK